MKNLLCLAVLLYGVAVFSQSPEKPDTNGEKPGKLEKLVIDDSVSQRLQQIKDSAILNLRLPDSNEISENLSRNVNSIMELQRDRKAKEKRAAMLRIGFGLALLAILIIGWRRRKKVGR